ncbi:MAG: hypothetical protein ACPLRW_02495 [Moorellales bacterium]
MEPLDPLAIDDTLILDPETCFDVRLNPVILAAGREVSKDLNLAQQASEFVETILAMAEHNYAIASVIIGCLTAINIISANVLLKAPSFRWQVVVNEDGVKCVVPVTQS